MRNKGFFWFLTITLVVVCIYQLSFTYFSSKEETKAEKEAVILVEELKNKSKSTNNIGVLPNGTEVDFSTPESEEIAKAAFINEILKEKADKKVYPVFGSTFQEVKNRSLAFGLDLVGGMSVTLEISVPELVKSYARNPKDLRFKKPFDNAMNVYNAKGGDFINIFRTEFEKANKGKLIVREFEISEIEELDKNSSNEEVVNFLNNKVASSMDGVEQIMNKRINQFGVAQPNIQKDATTNRLYIELPGVQDETTVAEKLQSTANLQFFETYTVDQLAVALSKANELSRKDEVIIEDVVSDSTTTDSLQVVDTNKTTTTNTSSTSNTLGFGKKSLLDLMKQGSFSRIGYVDVKNKLAVDAFLKRNDIQAVFPEDLKFMWSANVEDIGENNQKGYVLYAVIVPAGGKALVGGKDISNASTGRNQEGTQTVVNVEMTTEGSEKWADMTSRNLNKQIAISMDDVIYSAPNVISVIRDGRTEITGNFTIESAKDLAGLLNGGALPAPCVIKEKTKIGPSIGSENSKSGLISFGIALAAVFLYMIFFYGKSGVVADVTLLANMIFIFGSLASFGAVLTLAGIAGIVLTIGMAVDANVLIFERIREEMRGGLDNKSAIESGFSKALASIIDANVTTLLTAIVLKVFGSGPIESFATTLIIGIFTSVFSAVVITRLIILKMSEKGKTPNFSTSFTDKFLVDVNVNFVDKRKVYYVISGILIIGSIVALTTRKLNPSVEFSGGRTFSVKFDQKADIEHLRANLSKVFVTNGKIASIDLKTKGNSFNVDITTNFKLSDESATVFVNEKLNEGLAMCKAKMGNFKVMESRSVSASISQELISSSIITIIFSLVIMFAYILFRFGKWQYSAGAIIALAHDVIIVLGIFAAFHGKLGFNMDVDQSFIAAILTVIGYSINDTVIIFDRIREYLRLRKNEGNQVAQINDSLNSTLSRTFSTSFTTFLVLLIIFMLGGAAIKGFVFALMVGVLVGTYSSICIATPVLIDLTKKIKGKVE